MTLFWFLLGPLLLVPMLFGFRALASRKLAILGVSFLSVTVGLAIVPWQLLPHYYAPATCAIYAYLVQAMRAVRYTHWHGGPVGRSLVRSIACIAIVMTLVRALADPLGIHIAVWPPTWFNTHPGNADRAAMLAELRERPEKTLVVVRYSASHNPEHEWVYNDADIDRAKVIWAREMTTGNQQLVDYFHDRRILLLEPDVSRETLRPYTIPPGMQ
jgi:hypothetical protein